LFAYAAGTLRAAGTPVPARKPTTVVVQSGPYRFSRNPIYLAFSLLQFGLAIWSVTVYDSEGYLQPNPYNAYSVNSLTAKRGTDGSITIQFGGCDGEIPNCLPIVNGWNYTVRLFRPRREILDDTWKFPLAHAES
jgi:hypothetical protein